MRVVIQRVTSASVFISGEFKSGIQKGLLILLGILADDTHEDIHWLVQKIINLRIFPDKSNVMNLSVPQIEGEILVVSQFTLYASTKKGNRPSYLRAARPEIAIPLYEEFIGQLAHYVPVETGIFGADMRVNLQNDGPVTIIIDSKTRE